MIDAFPSGWWVHLPSPYCPLLVRGSKSCRSRLESGNLCTSCEICCMELRARVKLAVWEDAVTPSFLRIVKYRVWPFLKRRLSFTDECIFCQNLSFPYEKFGFHKNISNTDLILNLQDDDNVLSRLTRPVDGNRQMPTSQVTPVPNSILCLKVT